jgi:sugar phosphate isomerase/epimerase
MGLSGGLDSDAWTAHQAPAREGFQTRRRGEAAHSADLLEGSVDWPGVMAALVKVAYSGFVSPEIGRDPNDPDKINKISHALDKILGMA